MCPKRSKPAAANRQRGFLLPVALFVIVVMGFAALALTRTSSQTNVSAVQELVSTQAFYAAESGLQKGLNQVLYDVIAQTEADSRCEALDQTLDFAGTEGLNLCTVRVECERVESGSYRLIGRGRCGSGAIRAERDLEVQARF